MASPRRPGWDVDHAGWVVRLLAPDRERFRGRTLEEALARCPVRPMADERGGSCEG